MPSQFFSDRAQIEQVIRKAVYCQVAFSVDDQPYVLPMNYGYADGCFYLHSKPTGEKLEMMKVNPKVGFNLQSMAEPWHYGDKGEQCSMRYVSVAGSGIAVVIEDPNEKQKALNIIGRQYDLPSEEYSSKLLQALTLIRLEVTEMTGKAANVNYEELFASSDSGDHLDNERVTL